MALITLRFDDTHIRIATRRSATARAILAALPFEAIVQTWGQQVTFDCPVRAEHEPDASNIIQPGDIAFWSDGSCISIGFGPTPISRQGEIRLAHHCNIWGDALDDVRALANVRAGTRVCVSLCEEHIGQAV